ncbi:MAG: hypothetical protein ACYCZR_06085 [Burkholderiales bacterium]
MGKKENQRDLVFLQEMLRRFDKGRAGDITEYDMVRQMIVDWIDELEDVPNF